MYLKDERDTMEGVIDKVIEIEYKAQKVVQEAVAEQNRILEDIEKETQALKEEILGNVSNKINQIKSKEIEEAKNEAEKILHNASVKAENMKKEAELNKKTWLNQLFRNVTGW